MNQAMLQRPKTPSESAITRPVAVPLAADGMHRRLYARLLPWLERGGSIYTIDGGNVFAPAELLQAATRAGLDVRAIARRVFLSRAYTCHQLLEACDTMLPPLTEQRPPPLALVLQVDRLFHDEDVALEERQYLFDRIRTSVTRVHAQGLPVVMTLCPGAENPWTVRLAGAFRIAPEFGRALTAR